MRARVLRFPDGVVMSRPLRRRPSAPASAWRPKLRAMLERLDREAPNYLNVIEWLVSRRLADGSTQRWP